jgi:hypothetical protein
VSAFRVGLAALVIAACSATGPAREDVSGACRQLASRCHKYDTGEGLAHDCHDLGHADTSTDEQCAARRLECLAACPLTDGGNDPRDAVPDLEVPADAQIDGDPGDTLCLAFCACMAETCTSTAGYPYADARACAGACGQLGQPERACFPSWCAQAKNATGTRKSHLCEHAWGKFGLDECP